MNLAANSAMIDTNILPLFATVTLPEVQEEQWGDPLGKITESAATEVARPPRTQHLVSSEQFPDQAMFILDEQLAGLRERMGRLKYYLNELEDLLPQ